MAKLASLAHCVAYVSAVVALVYVLIAVSLSLCDGVGQVVALAH